MPRSAWPLLLSALVLAPTAGAAVFVAAADGTYDGCAAQAMHFALVGLEMAPGTWLFVIAGVHSDVGCHYPAGASPFLGPWSLEGGCLPNVGTDLAFGGLLLCLEPQRGLDGTTAFRASVCDAASVCLRARVEAHVVA